MLDTSACDQMYRNADLYGNIKRDSGYASPGVVTENLLAGNGGQINTHNDNGHVDIPDIINIHTAQTDSGISCNDCASPVHQSSGSSRGVQSTANSCNPDSIGPYVVKTAGDNIQNLNSRGLINPSDYSTGTSSVSSLSPYVQQDLPTSGSNAFPISNNSVGVSDFTGSVNPYVIQTACPNMVNAIDSAASIVPYVTQTAGSGVNIQHSETSIDPYVRQADTSVGSSIATVDPCVRQATVSAASNVTLEGYVRQLADCSGDDLKFFSIHQSIRKTSS